MFFVNAALNDISIGTAGLVALLGYAVVFVGLIALMAVIMIVGKIMVAKKSAPAAAPAAADEPITGEVFRAPMGGRIVEINVKPGDAVKKGQVVMVYEAMKMENDLEAPKDTVIKRIFVTPDQVVGTDDLLIEFE